MDIDRLIQDSREYADRGRTVAEFRGLQGAVVRYVSFVPSRRRME